MSQSSSHDAPGRFRGRSRALGVAFLAVPAALTAGAVLGLPSAFATGTDPVPVSAQRAADTAGQTPAPVRARPSGSLAPTPGPDERAVSAFFAKGYDYDDAAALAKIWHTDSPYSAKVKAGQKLLAGQDLPVRPHPQATVSAEEERAVSTFFAKGYDYDDAVKLAKIWHTDSPYSAKVKAGHKLLAGQQLPAQG